MEKSHVTIQAAIDLMAQNGTQINWFWINRFVKRNGNVFTIQTANLLEKERHNVSEEDLRNYFDTMSIQFKTVPSLSYGMLTRLESSFPRSPPHRRSLWQNRHSQKLS
jgi:membrane carboxypeptidase/penicillin-binding protein